MTESIPTPESFKQKAKAIRKFLFEKCNIDLSHSHCLELASIVYGIKNWNTASAISKANAGKISFPIEIRNVGAMRKALSSFDDSDQIDFEFSYKLKTMIEEIEDLVSDDADLEDVIEQEFSAILEKVDQDGPKPAFATFKLKLENESVSHHIPTEFPPDCGFHGS